MTAAGKRSHASRGVMARGLTPRTGGHARLDGTATYTSPGEIALRPEVEFWLTLKRDGGRSA